MELMSIVDKEQKPRISNPKYSKSLTLTLNKHLYHSTSLSTSLQFRNTHGVFCKNFLYMSDIQYFNFAFRIDCEKSPCNRNIYPL